MRWNRNSVLYSHHKGTTVYVHGCEIHLYPGKVRGSWRTVVSMDFVEWSVYGTQFSAVDIRELADGLRNFVEEIT